MRTIALCATAFALSVSAVGNAATPDDAQNSVRVSYNDLNLSQPQDAAVLLERVQGAALQACGASPFSLPDYQDAVRRSSCYQTSVSRAINVIDAPLLTALHSQPATFAVALK